MSTFSIDNFEVDQNIVTQISNSNNLYGDEILSNNFNPIQGTTGIFIGENNANQIILSTINNNFNGNTDVEQITNITNNIEATGGYLELSDISIPSTPNNGEGKLYKKTNSSNIFWLTSDGIEKDLTVPVFGANYAYAESLSATIGGATFVNKILFSPSLSIGLHLITWSYQWDLSDTSSSFVGEVVIDGSEIIHQAFTSPSLSTGQYVVYGFKQVMITNTTPAIVLRFRRSGAGTVTISNACIDIHTVY